MQVRKATIADLECLTEFTAAEAKEAEGLTRSTSILRNGIKAALEDSTKAVYWVLVDEGERPVESASAVKEWSDWNAAYYWWVQSMYISNEHRGHGYVRLLMDEINQEMEIERGLELRLYVHRNNETAVRAYRKLGFDFTSYLVMKHSGQDGTL